MQPFLYRIYYYALYFVSVPIAMFFAVANSWLNLRLVGIQSNRIGHFALNTELMQCALDTGLCNKDKRTFFYNSGHVCNQQLDLMWRRVISIVPFSTLTGQIDRWLLLFLGKSYGDDAIKKTYEPCGSGAIDKHGLLEKVRQPHLFFIENEKEKAQAIMKQLGMTENAKFICLIIRDSAYLNRQYPNTDWSYHSHRNADVDHYQKAALFLADLGYYVLRMGKQVNKEFNVNHPRVIDYANNPLRSDFMDVYLCAYCEFCISTTTGLDCVSQIFRRPVLFTNVSPILNETLMWYPCTLFIPKLLRKKSTNQLLTLSESAPICCLSVHDMTKKLTEQDIEIVENTEDQILDVVKEMVSRVRAIEKESDDDRLLQKQYWTHYKKYFPVSVNTIRIRLGTEFLKQHPLLLN